MNYNFLEGQCECCKKSSNRLMVRASSIGPVSMVYCIACLMAQAEPYFILNEMFPNKNNINDNIVFYDKETDTYKYYFDDEVIKFTNEKKDIPLLTRKDIIEYIYKTNNWELKDEYK